MSEPQAAPNPGDFCWNELMTTDGPAARAFYTGLFGWDVEEKDMGPAGVYTLWQNDGKGAGGMMQMNGPQFEGVPPHWMSYVAVDDVDASAAKATELGGEIKVPPMDIPGIGRFAVLSDPQGAVFSLYKGLPQPPPECS